MTEILSVERNGINAVPDGQRHGRARDLFWPWAASNLSLFGIAYGVYVVGLGLGLVPAIGAGILGYLASFLLVGLVAVAGSRSGVPTMTLGRAAFGYTGNRLPTLFSYISNVGWETVLVTLSAQGGGAILARLAPGVFAQDGKPTTTALALCFVLAAGVTIVVGVYGHALIMRLQKYLTWLFVALTVVYMGLTLPHLDLAKAAALPTGGPGVFVGGIVFAMTLLGLGWVNCGADYSRYLPRGTRAGAVTWWTTLGGALPPIVLLVFGTLLVGGDPKLAGQAAADPVGALAGTLPTWFLVPYLVTAIGGFLSGSIMDIYSSGLSMLALGVPLRRHRAVLVDGALMVLGGWYLLFVSSSFLGTFQAFLAIIGVVMAAWASVFLVDMWRFRGAGYPERTLLPRAEGGRSVSWPGVVALVVATVVGLGLITSTDPNIAHVVGFLLTDTAQKSWIGQATLGVVVALLVAGPVYLLLTLASRTDSRD
ncbi:MAG: cytosine permease [Actinocatenispora sp.]